MYDLTEKTGRRSNPSLNGSDGRGDIGDILVVPAGNDVNVVTAFVNSLDPQIKDLQISVQESRRVLWKIDFTILPLMAVTTILAAVDKNIIGNTAILGILQDTNISKNQFPLVGSLFFIGYLVFEWPMALLIQQFPVGKLLPITVLGWGILAMCTAAVHNMAGLSIVRFLMGGLEAIVHPTNSILPNTISTAFTGIVSYAIGLTNTGIARWRMLFLVIGGFTILWACLLWIFLPDSPVSSWQLSDREKWDAIQRVKDNNTGVEDIKFKWYQVRELLVDPKTWLLVVFSAVQNVPNGGVSSFSGLIVSGFGFSTLQSILINLPTGVFGTTFQILLSIPSAKLKGYRCIIVACANLVPLVCAVLLWQLPRDNQHGLLASYLCFWTYFTPYVLSTSLPMANTSGHTKKVTMNALWFIAYSLGNILGPQAFRAQDAPNYTAGFTGLLVCIVVSIAAILMYGVLCRQENRKRERESRHTEGVHQVETSEAFNDLTDKEKPSFRYVY
ncbi:related to DAL5-Allantoate and ureidosuccinate permease [Fusarium fujikuroi]|nr:related to DAL5-Allantoate and ureidosuccinate permease [Fusarium fujikuroi]